VLIQFTVGNFRSFRERFTLSLEATPDDWLEEDNVAVVGPHRLIKAAAIYGANAGGKSNLLAAMRRFHGLIMSSSKESQAGEKIPVEPFRLNTESESAPTFFEAIFLQNQTRYRYGFEANADAIQTEWLWSQKDSIRETRLFTREAGVIDPSDAFKEGRGLEARTRPNALFLSVAAQFNGEIATSILGWMERFRGISGLDDKRYMRFTATALLSEPHYQRLIHELVRAADTGINELKVIETGNETGELAKRHFETMPPEVRRGFRFTPDIGFSIKTYHTKFQGDHQPAGTVEFDLRKEGSAGTQKFVAISGPFLHTLQDGSILCVDEMEARLHPKLTQALIGLFNSSANTKGAQLIFATHDQGLLNSRRIRRDQVWFVEKNDFGESRLYCLDEFKVRKEAKFEKEYLLGEFGAVPRLGDFQDVLTHGSE
jgi:AAA15 family ATPase/GTPase